LEKLKLSPHFTLREMTKSSTADRLSIDNTPDHPQVLKALQDLCINILEPARQHFGIPFSPSSAYRCPRLNQAIGSSPNSQHITGQAVDIEIPGVSNIDLAEWIKSNTVFDQLILEYYSEDDPSSGWVHVSYVAPRGGKSANRGEVLRFTGRIFKLGLTDVEIEDE
jgi:zinc D-Ala-D-Ala carboxypeptidase